MHRLRLLHFWGHSAWIDFAGVSIEMLSDVPALLIPFRSLVGIMMERCSAKIAEMTNSTLLSLVNQGSTLSFQMTGSAGSLTFHWGLCFIAGIQGSTGQRISHQAKFKLASFLHQANCFTTVCFRSQSWFQCTKPHTFGRSCLTLAQVYQSLIRHKQHVTWCLSTAWCHACMMHMQVAVTHQASKKLFKLSRGSPLECIAGFPDHPGDQMFWEGVGASVPCIVLPTRTFCRRLDSANDCAQSMYIWYRQSKHDGL